MDRESNDRETTPTWRKMCIARSGDTVQLPKWCACLDHQRWSPAISSCPCCPISTDLGRCLQWFSTPSPEYWLPFWLSRSLQSLELLAFVQQSNGTDLSYGYFQWFPAIFNATPNNHCNLSYHPWPKAPNNGPLHRSSHRYRTEATQLRYEVPMRHLNQRPRLGNADC